MTGTPHPAQTALAAITAALDDITSRGATRTCRDLIASLDHDDLIDLAARITVSHAMNIAIAAAQAGVDPHAYLAQVGLAIARGLPR